MHRFMFFSTSYDLKNFRRKHQIKENRNIPLKINFNSADNSCLEPYKQLKMDEINIFSYEDITLFSENGAFMDRQKCLYIKSYRGRELDKYNLFYNVSFFSKPLRVINKATYLFAPSNYWHFHFEYLVRLVYLEQFHPDVLVFSNRFIAKWQKDILVIYGVDARRIKFIDPSKNKYFFFKEFCFLEFFGAQFQGFNDEFSVTLLKNRLQLDSSLKKKVYISRGKSKSRKILNEVDLLLMLKKYKFEVVFLEEHTVENQYRIFSEAKVIIAQHGAGLTNCLGSKGAHIIELFNPDWPMNMYSLLVSECGNSYYRINCKCINTTQPQSSDIIVDLAKVEDLISKILF